MTKFKGWSFLKNIAIANLNLVHNKKTAICHMSILIEHKSAKNNFSELSKHTVIQIPQFLHKREHWFKRQFKETVLTENRSVAYTATLAFQYHQVEINYSVDQLK